ncbi:MAG: dihydroorotase [Gammaproteobacteria bacterium]
MTTLTLIKPDDCHLHVRDGDVLPAVVPHTARQFARAIIMPNLTPPVTTTAMAKDYRERILTAVPRGSAFEPLMTLYLTDETRPAEIIDAAASGIVHGVKLYPAGATTNSQAGVTGIGNVYAALGAMQEHGLVLQVHGELTGSDVDTFDRESAFIDQLLAPLHTRFPALKIVFEHITTHEAVEFVRAAGPQIAATITPQHLLYNRNAIFDGGLRPHYYCLPILKRETHRRALVEAAISGNAKFFLGTDSAPHPQSAKESACGCAGIYSAHAAIELYTEVFEDAGALDRLEDFASRNGARFYGLPINSDHITIAKQQWRVPQAYRLGANERVVPLRANELLRWRLHA